VIFYHRWKVILHPDRHGYVSRCIPAPIPGVCTWNIAWRMCRGKFRGKGQEILKIVWDFFLNPFYKLKMDRKNKSELQFWAVEPHLRYFWIHPCDGSFTVLKLPFLSPIIINKSVFDIFELDTPDYLWIINNPQ